MSIKSDSDESDDDYEEDDFVIDHNLKRKRIEEFNMNAVMNIKNS